VLLARALGASLTGTLLAGPASILGHDFPLFTGFRGGKGLSTTVGVLLVWTPWSALIGLALFGLLQLILRNADRSIPFGAAAAIFLPPLFGHPWTTCLYALALFCMLWLRKLQDRRHQQRVWDASGWEGIAQSDWYGDAAGDAAEGDARSDGQQPPS
jgi:glycerol-3-phosphate acyltransferase PlsY